LEEYRYSLTPAGKQRVENGEFFMQDAPHYKGYTKKVFLALAESSSPLTIKQISQNTGLSTRIVSSVISPNCKKGFIQRFPNQA
jgi:DNA-binding MarR family transcriptional regulator